MRKIALGLAALAAAGLFAGSASAQVKVALNGPITGQLASFGEQMKRGAEMAVADINAKGGVNGQKITLVIGDDQCDAKQAVSVANRSAQDKVAVVIGHFCSGSSIPASDVYKEENILQISPASTNPKFTDRGYTNVFRVCGRDDQQGAVAGAYIVQHYKGKKVAIIHDKTAYGQGIAEVFKKTIEASGAKVTIFDGLASEEMDFRATISAIQKSGAQGVFWGGMYNQAGPFFNQLRQAGFKGAFLGGDGIYDPELIKTVGAKADSLFISFGPDFVHSEAAKPFLAAYKQKFNQEAAGYSIYGYDAANILLAAIQKAGTTDAAKVSEALRSQAWSGLMGQTEFDAKGDLKKANFVIWTIRDGTFAVR